MTPMLTFYELINIDKLVKILKSVSSVILAKARIQ